MDKPDAETVASIFLEGSAGIVFVFELSSLTSTLYAASIEGETDHDTLYVCQRAASSLLEIIGATNHQTEAVLIFTEASSIVT